MLRKFVLEQYQTSFRQFQALPKVDVLSVGIQTLHQYMIYTN